MQSRNNQIEPRATSRISPARAARAGIALALIAAAALILAGCSDIMRVEPAGFGTGTGGGAQISLQQVPEGIEEVSLSISGPDMETRTETLTAGTEGGVIEVPHGEDRTFSATAGVREAEVTTDVPASGVTVSLPLVLENQVESGDLSVAPTKFVLSEHPGSQQDIDPDIYGYFVLAVSEGVDVDALLTLDEFVTAIEEGSDTFPGGISGTGDIIGIQFWSDSTGADPVEGEYTAIAPDLSEVSAGDAFAGIAVDFDGENETFSGFDASIDRIATSGTLDAVSLGGEYSFSLELTTQEERSISGTIEGAPVQVLPTIPRDASGQYDDSDSSTFNLDWSDRSRIARWYEVHRIDIQEDNDGNITDATAVVVNDALAADAESAQDSDVPSVQGTSEIDSYFWVVRACTEAGCSYPKSVVPNTLN